MNSKLVSQKWLQKAVDDLEWTRANLQEKVWYGACFTALPLVDYYVQTRYPDVGEFMDFTGQKAEEALLRAEKLIELVKTKLD